MKHSEAWRMAISFETRTDTSTPDDAPEAKPANGTAQPN
jgi:hypothetical protein